MQRSPTKWDSLLPPISPNVSRIILVVSLVAKFALEKGSIHKVDTRRCRQIYRFETSKSRQKTTYNSLIRSQSYRTRLGAFSPREEGISLTIKKKSNTANDTNRTFYVRNDTCTIISIFGNKSFMRNAQELIILHCNPNQTTYFLPHEKLSRNISLAI